ncbi:MAG: LysM peptidoglycan-binding domain-containing protein [Deltaproteobacteria bacterium]|nr:LysM peptidoglycan-binding domain-containing protein [Deltaproteobacteria bacterium]
MKKALLLVVFAPAIASAQVPVYPSGTVAQPPMNLDPGAAPAPIQSTPPPQPQAPQKPNIVVVKPDGTAQVVGAPEDEPHNFYANSGGDTGGTQEPAEVHAGPVPELHVVRKGDTLWDICWYYFNDPWQWPKVWSYNPQISNPHWIYPGDLVRLLPRGVFAGGDQEPEGQGSGATATPVDNLPAPQQRTGVALKQTAFVEKSEIDNAITIDGAVDEKVLLGTGDSVYLRYPKNKEPKVGQKYSIYEPTKSVKDKGSYVHVVGTVEVVSVKEDKRARGVIVESTQEIERGLKVGPLAKEFKTVPPVPPSVDAQGSIVARLKPAQLIGQGELVFIDLGEKSGIAVGNRMFVVRRGDAYPGRAENTIGQDDRRFPARSIGEIVVVEVGKNISAGLVTLSVQEMGMGDIVMMQKAK